MKLSKTEAKLLALLTSKPQTTGAIVGRFYAGRKAPQYPKQTVANALASIKRKRAPGLKHQAAQGTRPAQWWRV